MMGAVAEETRVFDSSYDNKRVELPAGAVFELILPEKPTTGYRWRIVSNHKPETDSIDPPPSTPGAGTVRHFCFLAEQSGESILALQLRRSWEREAPPAATFTLHIVIRPSTSG